jgi:hypothetical protein
MTTDTITHPVHSATANTATQRRGTVVLGIVAAVTGVAGCLGALPDIPAASRKDPTLLVDAVLALGVSTFRVAAAALVISALLVAVLADSTRRHLIGRAGDGALATLGMTATSIGLAAGAAGAAQLGWVIHKRERGLVGPAWNVVDTIPFASFMGIGLAAGSCAVASLRHKTFPRWFGIISALVTVLILGLSIASLPFASFAPGALWLIALGIAIRPAAA